MTPDPIIDEIRAIRDEIAREHDYDLGAIFETFRRMERESGRKSVTLEPRRPVPRDGTAGERRPPRDRHEG